MVSGLWVLTPCRPCSHQRRNHKHHDCRSWYSKWPHFAIVSGVKNESFSFETATTLTFLVYMLSQNPDVMHRLREEILRTVGPSRRPTHEDVRDMKYMRAVINGHFISFLKCDMHAQSDMQKRFAFIHLCECIQCIICDRTNLSSSPFNMRLAQLIAPFLEILTTNLKDKLWTSSVARHQRRGPYFYSGEYSACHPSIDIHVYLSNTHRVIYSVFQMHRRSDLWGPDGTNYFDVWSTSHLIFSSSWIWSWSIPRWTIPEISSSTPIHFPSFQCWS